MIGHENLVVNSLGNLEIGGCDCTKLAEQYGTPLYVMDENLIREKCRIYKNAIDKYYDGNGIAIYASKAFSTMAMCKLIDEENLGLDVVSGGELYTAIKAGFQMNKVYFHGNNKTYDELEMAIDNDIRRIIVDNKNELEMLNEIAIAKNKIANISFRIKPGIDAHTHDFIRTGQIDSKFGVALENGEAFDIISYASTLSNIKVVGVHCHIGSQIFDIDPFELAAKVMMEFIIKVRDELNITIEELNLGGGFGIKYVPEDNPVELDKYIETVSKIVKSICAENEFNIPYIVMEPGRSIVGTSGITLYTVGEVKDIKNIRKYVFIDGGMTDNPRYALYQSEYDAFIANKPLASREELVTIAGKCCESGDLLIKDIMMPVINTGDIMAILSTGAYNYSMASNYNRIRKPAVIFVKNGVSRVVVKRETYEDIISNDII